MTSMTDTSYIHRYAENLGHGRGIMRVDVVVDGELIDSHTEGSPAPIETVRQHERRTPLGTAKEITHDDIVLLTSYLADNGFDAHAVAYAVEKPHKYLSELALAKAELEADQ